MQDVYYYLEVGNGKSDRQIDRWMKANAQANTHTHLTRARTHVYRTYTRIPHIYKPINIKKNVCTSYRVTVTV